MLKFHFIKNKKIIFFDGVCSLCNGFINLIFFLDSKRVFKIASLQGKTAKKLIDYNILNNINSVVVVDDNKLYFKSEAIILIFSKLNWPWKIIILMKYIPQKVRDKIYDLISKNRYNLFRKRNICRFPTKEESKYFLE